MYKWINRTETEQHLSGDCSPVKGTEVRPSSVLLFVLAEFLRGPENTWASKVEIIYASAGRWRHRRTGILVVAEGEGVAQIFHGQ